jgi:hypothetical protein
MEKAYQDLDIQFLPDTIVSQLNQEKLTAVASHSISLAHDLNSLGLTEVVAKNDGAVTDLIFTKLTSMTEYLINNLH